MSEDLKGKFQGVQLDGLRDMSQGPFVSNGKSVFYAGKGNQQAAEKYARENGMTPIQETKTGKILSNLDKGNFERQFGTEGKKIWDAASRNYAASVEGQVRTFVAGAGPRSTFRRVELPAVLNNKNVKEINGIDREKIDQSRRQNFERMRGQGVERRDAALRARETAYVKVALGEVRQDLKRAEQTKDENLLRDANRRLEAIRGQARLENQTRREQRQASPKEMGKEVAKKSAPALTPAERYGKIEQRTYDRKVAQGVSPENAKLAGQDRSRHVQQRMGLAAERNALKAQGEKLPMKTSQAHHERREAHQQTRVQDLQKQAQRENREYKGPPAQSQEARKIETASRAESFTKNVRLDAAKEAGRFTDKEHQSRKTQIQEGISSRRNEALRQHEPSRQPAESHGQNPSRAPDETGQARKDNTAVSSSVNQDSQINRGHSRSQ